MKNPIQKLFIVSLSIFTLFTANAFADLPMGAFSGFTSGKYGEICDIDQAEVQFSLGEKGVYQLRWEEHGNQFVFGGGFCDLYLNADLIPTGKANEWDMRFTDRSDLIFGKAVLNGTHIEINASFSGFQSWANRLRAEFTMDENKNTLDYRRVIESNFGPTYFATGILTR